jgi:hypothetical protein
MDSPCESYSQDSSLQYLLFHPQDYYLWDYLDQGLEWDLQD